MISRITYLIFLTLVCSCSNDSKIIQSNVSDSSHSIVVQTKSHSTTTPLTTPLPFGPNKTSKDWYNHDFSFYAKLISTDPKLMDFDSLVTPTYNLPTIKTTKYIRIEKDKSYICSNGQSVDSMLKLSKYRYKLPNIAHYESYYMSGCNYGENDYSKTFWNECSSFAYTCYGYLILYDTKTKSANVLDIYFTNYQDGVNVERRFYIDRNFKIELVDLGTVEEEESYVRKKVSVDITKTGDIKVNEHK